MRTFLGTPAGRITSLFVVALAVFLVRAIRIGTTYDIFIDEVTYLHIARNVADSLRVTLYGEPFYLHPPAFFFIEAAYLKVFRISGTLVEQIYAVRYLNALFAGLSAAALYDIARRFAGWRAGLLAVVVFALDPFPIKMNSYNLLDTSAVWWVLLGYWILLAGWHEDGKDWTLGTRLRQIRTLTRNGRPLAESVKATTPIFSVPRIKRSRVYLAGLAFGLALLTKDMTAFLTLLPLVVCIGTGWCLNRRDAIRITAVAFLTYAVYPLIVLFAGQWSYFEEEKLSGLYRLVGLLQTTGVNREVGPSLLQIIWNRLEPFGSTYVLLALGTGAVVYLLLYGQAPSRLLAIWTGSAYTLLAYAVLFGTLEEQFFYLLLPAAILAVAVAAFVAFDYGMFGRFTRIAKRSAQILAVLFLSWGVAQWIRTHTLPDNGYERVLTYIDQNLSHGATVAATSETAQFLLKHNASGPWGPWHTVDELERYCPDYLMVSTDSLLWNFGADARGLLTWVETNGTLIYEFAGRNANHLALYDIPCSTDIPSDE